MGFDILFLGTLGTVETSALLPVLDAFGIQDAADDVVPDSRKVFHAASADEDDAVFLEVVSLSHDVGIHFVTIRQTHTGDFAESGVRFLRRHRRDFQTHPAAGRRSLLQGDHFGLEGVPGELEGRRLRFFLHGAARPVDELVNGGHGGGRFTGFLVYWFAGYERGGL